MIEINNITKNKNIISAYVSIIGGCNESFKIVVDSKEQIIISCTRKTDMYVIQALSKLIKLSEEYGNKMPKKAESVWY